MILIRYIFDTVLHPVLKPKNIDVIWIIMSCSMCNVYEIYLEYMYLLCKMDMW